MLLYCVILYVSLVVYYAIWLTNLTFVMQSNSVDTVCVVYLMSSLHAYH